MTDLQEKQLREYRIKGFGYKAIATVLGLSRDVVRNYCKNHSLEGFAYEVAVNIEEQIQQGSACLCCAKAIQQTAMGRKRKFCSEKCRREWWLAHPEAVRKKETAIYEKTCVYCGKPFIVCGNRNRRYCRHECYVHDRFWREEEGRDSYINRGRGGYEIWRKTLPYTGKGKPEQPYGRIVPLATNRQRQRRSLP